MIYQRGQEPFEHLRARLREEQRAERIKYHDRITAYEREYGRKPEVRERRNEKKRRAREREEVIAQEKAYRRRPEVRARRRELAMIRRFKDGNIPNILK